MSYTKRDATPEEEAAAVELQKRAYPQTDYDAQLIQCKAEGLKSEVCSCGGVFPAFIHFVRCNVPNDQCPMKGAESKSVMDMLLGDDE